MEAPVKVRTGRDLLDRFQGVSEVNNVRLAHPCWGCPVNSSSVSEGDTSPASLPLFDRVKRGEKLVHVMVYCRNVVGTVKRVTGFENLK